MKYLTLALLLSVYATGTNKPPSPSEKTSLRYARAAFVLARKKPSPKNYEGFTLSLGDAVTPTGEKTKTKVKYQVDGQMSTGNWVEIASPDGQKGWVPEPLLQASPVDTIKDRGKALLAVYPGPDYTGEDWDHYTEQIRSACAKVAVPLNAPGHKNPL